MEALPLPSMGEDQAQRHRRNGEDISQWTQAGDRGDCAQTPWQSHGFMLNTRCFLTPLQRIKIEKGVGEPTDPMLIQKSFTPQPEPEQGRFQAIWVTYCLLFIWCFCTSRQTTGPHSSLEPGTIPPFRKYGSGFRHCCLVPFLVSTFLRTLTAQFRKAFRHVLNFEDVLKPD